MAWFRSHDCQFYTDGLTTMAERLQKCVSADGVHVEK